MRRKVAGLFATCAMIKKHYIIFKYIFYALLLLVVYVLQTTPRLFLLCGVKPMLVVPVAICIAVYEGDFIGGLFGILAGMLCDMGARTYFGFNAIVMLIICTLCGIAIVLFIRQSWYNVLLLCAGALFIRGSLEFFFYYGMWGYADTGWIFFWQVLFATVYTALFSPLINIVVKNAKQFFDDRVEV